MHYHIWLIKTWLTEHLFFWRKPNLKFVYIIEFFNVDTCEGKRANEYAYTDPYEAQRVGYSLLPKSLDGIVAVHIVQLEVL